MQFQETGSNWEDKWGHGVEASPNTWKVGAGANRNVQVVPELLPMWQKCHHVPIYLGGSPLI